MATVRIPARLLRKGHVLAVTGERVVWRNTGARVVALELVGEDGEKRVMTYAEDVMVQVEPDVAAEDECPSTA